MTFPKSEQLGTKRTAKQRRGKAKESHIDYSLFDNGKDIAVRLPYSALETLCREIYTERNGECETCGDPVLWGECEFDHIKTKGAGGGDTKDNIKLKCASCHDKRHRAL